MPQKEREYPTRISDADRGAIGERIQAGWKQGLSVDHSFASAWDQGVMLASRRTWWRIAAALQDQSSRPAVPTWSNRGQPPSRAQAPVLCAMGPGQVWSWDITDLRSNWRGVAYKAYSIIDIYSRKIVGYRVEEREADHLAVEMFEKAFTEHGRPGTVHSDSGASMRSAAMKDYLAKNGVNRTHSRPRVSNDNPFSESEFRTMKYRPNYPGTFESLQDARDYLSWYVSWYNQNHKHSGIALFTPDEVHTGAYLNLWHQRHQTQQAYYQAHPTRFHQPPRTPTPSPTVGINLPKTTN